MGLTDRITESSFSEFDWGYSRDNGKMYSKHAYVITWFYIYGDAACKLKCKYVA